VKAIPPGLLYIGSVWWYQRGNQNP